MDLLQQFITVILTMTVGLLVLHPNVPVTGRPENTENSPWSLQVYGPPGGNAQIDVIQNNNVIASYRCVWRPIYLGQPTPYNQHGACSASPLLGTGGNVNVRVWYGNPGEVYIYQLRYLSIRRVLYFPFVLKQGPTSFGYPAPVP